MISATGDLRRADLDAGRFEHERLAAGAGEPLYVIVGPRPVDHGPRRTSRKWATSRRSSWGCRLSACALPSLSLLLWRLPPRSPLPASSVLSADRPTWCAWWGPITAGRFALHPERQPCCCPDILARIVMSRSLPVGIIMPLAARPSSCGCRAGQKSNLW